MTEEEFTMTEKEFTVTYQGSFIRKAALVIALSAVIPMHAFASAGIAQFAAGDVSVKRGTGDATLTKLTKGSPIESGDVIDTGPAGHAQIRFSDGGLVSLQPNTLFNIKKYADENDPKKDGFFVDLFRGSMRAVTGLIGKRNHDNYQVTTQTATIGIRGSAFFAGYNEDGSLSVSTEQDAIVVCTNGGCTDLRVGESVRVTSSSDLPTRTNQRTSLPVDPPRQDPTAAANKTDEKGNIEVVAIRTPAADTPPAVIVPPDNPTGPPPVDRVNGTFADFHSQFLTTTNHYSSDFHTRSATIADDLLSHSDWSYGAHDIAFTNTGGPAMGGVIGSMDNNDFIGWGYWTQGTLTDTQDGSSYDKAGVHYLVGVPSSGVDMPNYGTATYAFASGATTSERAGAGQITSASLAINFGASTFASTINTQFGANTVSVIISSSHGNVNSNGTLSGSHDDNYMKGFVSGHFASTAGLLFRYHDAPVVGTVTGVATFNQSSSQGLGYPPP